MKRSQLIELEDLPWFPVLIRDSMTDHLSFLSSRAGRVFKTFAEKLADALKRTKDDTLVELCAGGGGPSVALAKHVAHRLGRQPDVVLTDLYPNIPRMELVSKQSGGSVRFIREPVNACAVGPDPKGFRLCFNSFHHLPEDVALACLADAVKHRRGIAVMELVDRSIFGFLQVVFATLTIFLVAPFERPFKWSRLFWVYIIPIIPFAIFFDGIVSCLRVYSPDELKALVAKLPTNNYQWDIGTSRESFLPVRITYLLGTPTTDSTTKEKG